MQAFHESIRGKCLEVGGFEARVPSVEELLQEVKAEAPWLSAQGSKEAESAIATYKQAFSSKKERGHSSSVAPGHVVQCSAVQ